MNISITNPEEFFNFLTSGQIEIYVGSDLFEDGNLIEVVPTSMIITKDNKMMISFWDKADVMGEEDET